MRHPLSRGQQNLDFVHCRYLDPVLAEHREIVVHRFGKRPAVVQKFVLVFKIDRLRSLITAQEEIGMRPVGFDLNGGVIERQRFFGARGSFLCSTVEEQIK